MREGRVGLSSTLPHDALIGGDGDAVRHSLWAALSVAYGVDPGEVRAFLTLHETSQPVDKHEQQLNHMFMDLNNNKVGIAIGITMRDAGASQSYIISYIVQAVDQGGMLILTGNPRSPFKPSGTP